MIDWKWQDIVLMIGGFVFSFALLPTLRSAQKPPRSTCLITVVILSVYCVVYVSLGFWLALSATLLNKGAWLWVMFQKRGK